MIFDYIAAARRAGIAPDRLERLSALIRSEFPSDEMMAELHILRAILSIQRGETTLDDILRQEVAS